MPYGLSKHKKIGIFTGNPELDELALKSGADRVGDAKLIEEVRNSYSIILILINFKD